MRFASSVLDRTDSLRYIRVRLASTVLTDMKSSAAVSWFERPDATSSATRRSVSVSVLAVGCRPTRQASSRARSAHRGIPISSKALAAAFSASLARRL